MTTAELFDADVLPSAGKTGVLIVPKYDEGHAKFEWDSENETDVREAREQFDRLKKLGYSFFLVDPKTGEQGKKVSDFDPKAGKIIAVPAFQGG